MAQEALRQLLATAELEPAPDTAGTVGVGRVVRVGVGCDRGLHRSVAVAEAATAQLARLIKAAASVAVEGEGHETVPVAVEPEVRQLLKSVELLGAHHRELQLPDKRKEQEEQEQQEEEDASVSEPKAEVTQGQVDRPARVPRVYAARVVGARWGKPRLLDCPPGQTTSELLDAGDLAATVAAALNLPARDRKRHV